MSDNAITIEGLGKLYKLYNRPIDKVLDVFGLNFLWRKDCQEFWALREINLEIKKGERIGLIGRNGAGKSTLLKSIIGNVQPTEGNIKVIGNIQALMELGTGFHPEFTGRQNIRASLAYQGLTTKEIDEKEAEIIDFAELEDFIDQPIKTYSAGMYARLAFSSATAIEPEILIIDEVLGAGDAYFASKCVDRMKKLTQSTGTTVIFVSHDMSSVEMLCDRSIWIERGRVKMDGPTSVISKAYAQEVRERTAQRIRNKNAMVAMSEETSMPKMQNSTLQLIVRFIQEEVEPIEIHSVKLVYSNSRSCVVKVGDPQDSSIEYDGFVLIDDKFSNWGRPIHKETGHSRQITGEVGKCSAIVFNVETSYPLDNLQLEFEWTGTPNSKARVEVYDGKVYRELTRLVTGEVKGSWTRWAGKIKTDIVNEFLLANGFANKPKIHKQMTAPEGKEKEKTAITVLESPNVSEMDEIFDGHVLIKSVSFENGFGDDASLVNSFEKLFIHIDYRVLKGPLPAEFVVCMHRLGIIAMQVLSGVYLEDGIILDEGSEGRFTFEVPSLPLGKGDYLVSVGIFPPLNYYSLDTEKTAYILQDRRYEIKVEQPESIEIDLGMCRSRIDCYHTMRP